MKRETWTEIEKETRIEIYSANEQKRLAAQEGARVRGFESCRLRVRPRRRPRQSLVTTGRGRRRDVEQRKLIANKTFEVPAHLLQYKRNAAECEIKIDATKHSDKQWHVSFPDMDCNELSEKQRYGQ
ncbi:hypothetical protein EVAR_34470_1 [Eumeta japonica]|uniref:Uncharacterized protein n=1 Tax=Eumeta variegata TaxID=151549 RepID=A0A4C1WTY8_EUMVA|nr:hypothetical protein EVAR_34470_1 [Eumeta japonica]